jgi:DNA-binding NtrC family response regulator
MCPVPSSAVAGPARPKILLASASGGAELLSALGVEFETTVVPSADEAMAALRRSAAFDVVLAEAEVPPLGGSALLKKVLAEHRGLLGVLISSYADYLKQRDKSGDDPYLLLVKPYQPAQVTDTVRRAVKFAQLRKAAAGALSDLKVAK